MSESYSQEDRVQFWVRQLKAQEAITDKILRHWLNNDDPDELGYGDHRKRLGLSELSSLSKENT